MVELLGYPHLGRLGLSLGPGGRCSAGVFFNTWSGLSASLALQMLKRSSAGEFFCWGVVQWFCAYQEASDLLVPIEYSLAIWPLGKKAILHPALMHPLPPACLFRHPLVNRQVGHLQESGAG